MPWPDSRLSPVTRPASRPRSRPRWRRRIAQTATSNGVVAPKSIWPASVMTGTNRPCAETSSPAPSPVPGPSTSRDPSPGGAATSPIGAHIVRPQARKHDRLRLEIVEEQALIEAERLRDLRAVDRPSGVRQFDAPPLDRPRRTDDQRARCARERIAARSDRLRRGSRIRPCRSARRRGAGRPARTLRRCGHSSRRCRRARRDRQRTGVPSASRQLHHEITPPRSALAAAARHACSGGTGATSRCESSSR